MAFRIDYIQLRFAPLGWRLIVDFKGFRGTGTYATAEMDLDD